MTTNELREAAQRVLDAWQTSCYGQPSHRKATLLAMTDLNKALASSAATNEAAGQRAPAVARGLTEAQEREEFERLTTAAGGDVRRVDSGEYHSGITQTTWQGWQARAALSTPSPVAPEPVARPTDDDLWDQTLRERDYNCEWADKLADAIAAHLGVEIGEHSNVNAPWLNALDAIREAAPATPAEPVAPGGVPSGWALVPVEPTQEMLHAGARRKYGWEHGGSVISSAYAYFDETIKRDQRGEHCAEGIWRAMLGAIPPAPASEAPREVALPLLPFAVFDEFGKPADDRVQDYGKQCAEAAINPTKEN